MPPAAVNLVVHLELQTENLPRACAFFSELFGWRAESIQIGSGRYLVLGLGSRIEGGVVERESTPARWLPYVEVADIAEATERARAHGAAVELEAREGPVGWRSVLAIPSGAELGLWQPKR